GAWLREAGLPVAGRAWSIVEPRHPAAAGARGPGWVRLRPQRTFSLRQRGRRPGATRVLERRSDPWAGDGRLPDRAARDHGRRVDRVPGGSPTRGAPPPDAERVEPGGQAPSGAQRVRGLAILVRPHHVVIGAHRRALSLRGPNPPRPAELDALPG